MRFAPALLVAFVCSGALANQPTQRTLTFEDRVKAQEAIERVYYSHQIGATKPFFSVAYSVVSIIQSVLASRMRST